MSQSKVEIANPAPGGQRFTSPRRATKLIFGGQATMRPDGRLLLIGPAIEWRDRLEAAECEREFRLNHGERVYWNGDGKSGDMCVPGVARS